MLTKETSELYIAMIKEACLLIDKDERLKHPCDLSQESYYEVCNNICTSVFEKHVLTLQPEQVVCLLQAKFQVDCADTLTKLQIAKIARLL